MNRKAKTQVNKLLQVLADHTVCKTTSWHVYPQIAVTMGECRTCEDPVGMATTLRQLAKLVK
jgi:hypothetical protein